MSKTDKTEKLSATLPTSLFGEIDKRGEVRSQTITRDLQRYYGLIEILRPIVLGKFTASQLETLKNAWLLGGNTKVTRVDLLCKILVGLIFQEEDGFEMSERIKNMNLLEMITLIDLLDISLVEANRNGNNSDQC